MSTYLPDSKIAANAHRICHILDSNLDVKADVPLATVGSVLHRAGITPQQYGFSKLKPFLLELELSQPHGFLTFEERSVSGCPQTFATFHRRADWETPATHEESTSDTPAAREPEQLAFPETEQEADAPSSDGGRPTDASDADQPASPSTESDLELQIMRALGIAGEEDASGNASQSAEDALLEALSGFSSHDAAPEPSEEDGQPVMPYGETPAEAAPAHTEYDAVRLSCTTPDIDQPAGMRSTPEQATSPVESDEARPAASADGIPVSAEHADAAPAAASDPLHERARAIAEQEARTSAYADAPVPADLLAETARRFTSFCFASRNRQEDIRRNDPDCNPLEVLNVGWEAARAAGAVRLYEGKIVFPIPVLRGDGKMPLEVSIRRQEHSDGSLLPWFVSYVNDFVKQRPAADAPSKAIERFAWLGTWDEFLAKLADIALDEQWDFDGAPDENGHRNAILKSYLCTTFYRLQKEGKIAVSEDGALAAFNTGLVNDRYDDIYACFRPSARSIPWEFAGFTTAGTRGLGKELVSCFNPLPAVASYFDRKEDMLYDLGKDLIPDYDHIILDNMARLPLEFLAEELRSDDEATRLVADIRTTHDREARKQQYQSLRRIVEDDARLFRRLRSGLEDAIDTAKRRIRWNFKTAIPSYYPRANTMSLLLPLSLVREGHVDAALVVQLMPSGNYQGQTILTMRQAYTNARLICRPDSDWLTTSQAENDLGGDGEEDIA